MTLLPELDLANARRFAKRWEQMFYEGDWRGMAAVYEEDAELIAAGVDSVTGRPAIENFWRKACEGANAAGLRREVIVDRVERQGGLGYMRGIVRLRMRDDAAPMEVRYVTIWKRDRDDAWRLAVDISSPAAAPGAAASRL